MKLFIYLYKAESNYKTFYNIILGGKFCYKLKLKQL